MSLKDIFIDKCEWNKTFWSNTTGEPYETFSDKKGNLLRGITRLAGTLLEGRLDDAEQLIKEGHNVDFGSTYGQTPLDLVLKDSRDRGDTQEIESRRAKVDLLLANGADVNKARNALMDAVSLGDEVIAKKIVQHGISDDKIKGCIRFYNDPQYFDDPEFRKKTMAFLTNLVGKERMTTIQNEMAQEKTMAAARAKQQASR
jgi:ankyrin repeat protein